jgi:hypothetical protein
MKQDKYCEICRRKVAKLYSITLNKYVTNDYLVCSECIDAIQNYINRRLVR